MTRIIKYLFIMTLCFICACWSERDKVNYHTTIVIGEGIYVEFYEPWRGGVWSGSIGSAYLTDSLKMNIFLGGLEENEGFDFEIQDDILYIYKYSLSHDAKYQNIIEHIIDTIKVDLETKRIIK